MKLTFKTFCFLRKARQLIGTEVSTFCKAGFFLGSGSVRLYSQNYKLKGRRKNFLKLMRYDEPFDPTALQTQNSNKGFNLYPLMLQIWNDPKSERTS